MKRLHMKRLHIIVYGKVQGVFFRYNARQTALKLGLRGFVRNLEDGSVEVVAEGSESNLNELLKFCRGGPKNSEVVDVKFQYGEFKGEFAGFEIMH